ncbi:MAG TPA: tripartite tricarboxylate transporter substrate binding protein [Xanthobacteraceae bacterium]
MNRRRFLRVAGGAGVLPILSVVASALDYPNRPVRLIVGGVPGSAPDVIARLIAQWLSQRLGQAVFVENRNGASGNLAAEAVIAAPPDGYTLLLVSASNAINTTLYNNLKFNFIRDIAPVAGLVSFPMVIAMNSSFSAKSLAELIDYAKKHPGKLNIGTPPVGSPQHVAGELLDMMTGANIVFVAYRGGPPAISDALSGQIQGVIGTVLLTIEQIRSGKFRALAVTGARRSELLPDVPTVNEVVPGFEATQWIGIGAPKQTSNEIIERLNHEINVGLGTDALKARIINLGGAELSGSADEFGRFTTDEAQKWAKVIKFAGIKPE